jgi:hypothetical protein
MTRYNYRAPRKFNWVSILLLVGAIAGGYWGIKFFPVYWKAWKVDEVLDSVKNEASDLRSISDQTKREEVAEGLRQRTERRIRELGIKDHEGFPLEVNYTEGYTHIYAKYRVLVSHPVGSPSVMNMNRRVKIPSDRNL